MTERGSRIELVRYRFLTGKVRALCSRYADGAGVVFDLPVPYSFAEPLRVLASGIVSPKAMQPIAVEWFEKQRAQSPIEILRACPEFVSCLSGPPVAEAFRRTVVVNKARGESYDVNIGPGSKWANPYSYLPSSDPSAIRVATSGRAAQKYRALLHDRLRSGEVTLEDLAALHGRRLGCACKPRPCHGDVLAAASAWARVQLASTTS